MEFCPSCGDQLNEDDSSTDPERKPTPDQNDGDDVPWQQHGSPSSDTSGSEDSGYSLTALVMMALIALGIGYFVGHAVGMSSAETSVIDCYNTHIQGLSPSGQGFASCLNNEGFNIQLNN